jgi:hypothetical protein
MYFHKVGKNILVLEQLRGKMSRGTLECDSWWAIPVHQRWSEAFSICYLISLMPLFIFMRKEDNKIILLKLKFRSIRVVKVVEHLLSKHEALCSIPSTTKIIIKYNLIKR